MPDFRVANAEFDHQAMILQNLLMTIEVSAKQDGTIKHRIGDSELPVIIAGGQNTMAAAAMVLLAAHFEEYVRQQVEEYGKAVITEYVHLDDVFQSKLIDTYWRSGVGRLSRIYPKGDPLWNSTAEPLLRSLIGYPIGNDVAHFVATLLCEHDNNMRWETIVELMGRVGVKSFSDQLWKSSTLQENLGNPRKDRFTNELRQKLNAFYTTRNGLVHSIAQNSGIGPTVFDQWAKFFSILTTAIAEALEKIFAEFMKEVNKKKRR